MPYRVENIVRNGEIACLLQAISPFLTMFSTAIYFLASQNAVLCGNGLWYGPGLNGIGRVSLTDTNEKTPDSAEQAQIAHNYVQTNLHLQFSQKKK